MAGYYAGGGKSLMGGLGAFGEGAGFATLSMATEYGEINEWQPPAMTNDPMATMPSYGMSVSNLTMGTVPISRSAFLDSYGIANTWDAMTNQRILALDPRLQGTGTAFINAAYAAGIQLRIYDSYRTIAEQNEKWNQGRGGNPGKIITYARGGESPHNFGLAFDVVEIKNGKAVWVNPNWTTIGNLGKSFGFEWGGDWPPPKTDIDHFQMYWR